MDPIVLTVLFKGSATILVIVFGFAIARYGYHLYKDGAGSGRDLAVLELGSVKFKARSVGSIIMGTAFLWAWAGVALSPKIENIDENWRVTLPEIGPTPTEDRLEHGFPYAWFDELEAEADREMSEEERALRKERLERLNQAREAYAEYLRDLREFDESAYRVRQEAFEVGREAYIDELERRWEKYERRRQEQPEGTTSGSPETEGHGSGNRED